MEEFNAFNAIGEYIWDRGLALAISAIVIYSMFKLALIFIKWAQMKLLARHDELLDRRSLIDPKIQQLIEQTLYRVNGDRILVMEFHNSMKNLSLLPWSSITCNYEAIKYGLLPIGNSLKRISASLFSGFLTELHKDYVIIDDDNRDTVLGRSVYPLLVLDDGSSALSALMRDTQNKAVGYIALKKSVRFTDDDINIIKSIAGQIGALLCAQNTFEKNRGGSKNGGKK
jgi:GAF domain-containing protein